ncbi:MULTISPECIES: hypothetical protein [Salinibaculum]|uniref:hypothetical protein n=1 Tax=Salinibaculum TaxID=2732368 RepID=UPI0030D4921A
MSTVRVAVPRKGRPLEGVLERLARLAGAEETADDIISTLRFEKSITKDRSEADRDVYERLAAYSDLTDRTAPEYTLFRDDRDGMPRRIVFDSVTIPTGDVDVQLVGREEPFRALRTHEFALGFDSADLVLEEVVQLRDEAIAGLDEINDRIDPLDTDVRVVSGLGDTVHHTLLATPAVLAGDGDLDRAFVRDYEGPLCISPRYERLVEAVLGTGTLDGIEFTYPEEGVEEETAIAETGIGVYLTVTGSTARDNGLVLGEKLFPSETVLLANESEVDAAAAHVRDLLAGQVDAPVQ